MISDRRTITDIEAADDRLYRMLKAGFASRPMVASGERGGEPTMEFSLVNPE